MIFLQIFLQFFPFYTPNFGFCGEWVWIRHLTCLVRIFEYIGSEILYL